MKVFVYEKKKPFKRIAVIKNVHTVTEKPAENLVIFYTANGSIEFDTRVVKTSSFQN